MAYFSNGSEGMVFDDQCGKCRFGQLPCPIAWVQTNYNYDQVKDKSGTASAILNDLVTEKGVCRMREEFKDVLDVKEEPIVELMEKGKIIEWFESPFVAEYDKKEVIKKVHENL